MNDNDDPMNQHHQRPADEPAPREPKERDPAETAEMVGTPEAVKDADASRRVSRERLAGVRGRGVDWVRPTDLMAQGGGALSRRGIDFTAEVNRRARTGIVKGARWVGERARKLPPLSAFGRRGPAEQGQRRSGVGMR